MAKMDKPTVSEGINPLSNSSYLSTTQLRPRMYGEEPWKGSWVITRRKAAGIAIFVTLMSLICVLDLLVFGALGVNAAVDAYQNPCYGDMASTSGIAAILGYNVFIVQGVAFTTAKLIDIFVQLIVGQGGRALHAWVTYHVFSDAITRSLETTPASYAFILSAKFDPTSLGSLATYGKHLFRKSSTRQRWLAFWFLAGGAYVLAFPTLVGASAGYFSPLVPYAELPNGLLVSMEQSLWGDLPNERNNYRDTMLHCYGIRNETNLLPANASIVTQGALGEFFRDRSGEFVALVEYPCGWGWDAPLVCTQANGYIWGISTWMAVLALALEGIWICGMFGVWWDAQVASEFNRNNLHRFGIYRSVLDIAEALNEELGPHHALYSNSALEEAVSGTWVSFKTTESQSGGTLHIGLSSRGDGSVTLHRNTRYG